MGTSKIPSSVVLPVSPDLTGMAGVSVPVRRPWSCFGSMPSYAAPLI